METILTAEQAKEARSKIRLSQAKVAADLGINRAYLSLFEGGKYVFEDSALKSLRSYYQQHGYDFDITDVPKQTAPKPSAPIRVMDGFQVIGAMTEEEAEALLAEYVQNRAKINELCSQVPEESSFSIFSSEVDREDLRDRQYQILLLMARNFTLVEQLHGRETLLPCSESEAAAEKVTVGDYLRSLFADVFSFRGQGVPDNLHQEEAA